MKWCSKLLKTNANTISPYKTYNFELLKVNYINKDPNLLINTFFTLIGQLICAQELSVFSLIS